MKKLCILLAVLTVLGLLASCGSADVPAASAAGNETAAAAESEAETEDVVRGPYVPAADYDGASFHILTMTTTGVYWFAEEENGDALNDAVYRRNIATEDHLNIKISWEAECDYADLPGLISASVMAGDDAYQMVLTDSMRGNTTLVSGGLLYDLSTIDSIDFSRSYWNSSVLDALTIDGHVFVTKSSYTLPSVGLVTFNKQLIGDLGYDDPYALVRSGSWTLDTFIEMVVGAYSDLNGDGKADKEDRFGMTSMLDYPVDCFIYSSGLTLTKLNDKGRMELSLYGDRAIALYEKLDALLNQSGATYHWGWGDKDDTSKTISVSTGRTLFEMTRTDNLAKLRDSEVDFGIVPYPKLDSAQDSYTINDYSRLICVPVAVGDPEMVGQALETLAYFSTEYVYPAYYENLMKTKVVRDEDSIEMLDIIFNAVICDGGMTYFGLNGGAMQKLMYYVSTKLAKGSNNFSSYYAELETVAQGELDAFYDAVDANLQK